MKEHIQKIEGALAGRGSASALVPLLAKAVLDLLKERLEEKPAKRRPKKR